MPTDSGIYFLWLRDAVKMSFKSLLDGVFSLPYVLGGAFGATDAVN